MIRVLSLSKRASAVSLFGSRLVEARRWSSSSQGNDHLPHIDQFRCQDLNPTA